MDSILGTITSLAKALAMLTRTLNTCLCNSLDTHCMEIRKQFFAEKSTEELADFLAQAIVMGVFSIAGIFGRKINVSSIMALLTKRTKIDLMIHQIISNRGAMGTSDVLEEIEKQVNDHMEIWPFIYDNILSVEPIDVDWLNVFCEVFFTHYDPDRKETYGIYMTPEPVVSFMVRAVEWILKEKFGITGDISDRGVKWIDPGLGTGRFLSAAFNSNCNQGNFNNQYEGYEINITPYFLAYLRMEILKKQGPMPINEIDLNFNRSRW
ncbi:MAG: N-6 DNA methylase [Candidatus Omnitrophota bacterium]